MRVALRMGIALVVLSSILATTDRSHAGAFSCQPGDVQISLNASTFSPTSRTIAPGEVICFVLVSAPAPHTVTPSGPQFFTGSPSPNTLPPSPGFRETFPSAGNYTFFCETHGTPTSGMRGTITVSVPDTTPPVPPSNLSSDPPSPANENDPKIKGTAEAGSTVQLYTDDACDVAIGSPTPQSTFANPGIGVHVDDNTPTTFYATATDDADNVSDCSTDSVTYVEDSSDVTPPALVVLISQPKKRTTKRTATFTFVPEADASYFCKLDSRAPEDCSDGSLTYTRLKRTRHVFTVYGVDEFTNTGPTLEVRWRVLRR